MRTIGELYDTVSKLYSKDKAFRFIGRDYKYKDIDAHVTAYIKYFQDMGVEKGDKIALYMPNSPYYPILFFAAMKCGAEVVNFPPYFEGGGHRRLFQKSGRQADRNTRYQ